MARGNKIHLPTNIYFLKNTGMYNGPYTSKPTAMQNKHGGVILTFEFNKEKQIFKLKE